MPLWIYECNVYRIYYDIISLRVSLAPRDKKKKCHSTLEREVVVNRIRTSRINNDSRTPGRSSWKSTRLIHLVEDFPASFRLQLSFFWTFERTRTRLSRTDVGETGIALCTKAARARSLCVENDCSFFSAKCTPRRVEATCARLLYSLQNDAGVLTLLSH